MSFENDYKCAHLSQLWERAQAKLRDRVSFPAFALFFRDARLLSFEDNKATIGVATDFLKSYVCDNHMEPVLEVLSEIVGNNIAARIVVDSSIIASKVRGIQNTHRLQMIEDDYYMLSSHI